MCNSEFRNVSKNLLSSYCGLIIKRKRKEIGLTGFELARKLSISQQQLSRYERGVNKITIDNLFKISFELNVSFEQFINYIILEINENDKKFTKIVS